MKHPQQSKIGVKMPNQTHIITDKQAYELMKALDELHTPDPFNSDGINHELLDYVIEIFNLIIYHNEQMEYPTTISSEPPPSSQTPEGPD